MSQVFALLPAYLRQLGVPEDERLAFIGLFSSLVFVLGLPLVPLWGVWADKYSRKAVIVRSALVETVVFGLAAMAQEPWQVALAVLLIGFQLGNTGRDAGRDPGRDAASPPGNHDRPVRGGRPDRLRGRPGAGRPPDRRRRAGRSPGVFALSAGLSLGTALLVGLGTREVRPEVIPEGPVLRLAFGAVRAVAGDPIVRRLFVVYGVVFLANQMSRPYTPVLVEGITGTGVGLATGIALVMGVASLVGAVVSPAAGVAGDRLGFRPVLVAALVGGGCASLLMPLMPALGGLAAVAVLLGAAVAAVGAMVFSLLATEVAPERRSATLNLVYLPLYVAGIIGPAMGAAVASATGAGGPFVVGALVFFAGAAMVALRHPPRTAGTVLREAVPLS